MAGPSFGRMLLINVIVIIVVIGALFGGYIAYSNSLDYVSSADAQVTGKMIPITVGYAGRLTDWNVQDNTRLALGQELGAEGDASVLAMTPGLSQLVATDKVAARRLRSALHITAPIAGIVVQDNASTGQVVEPGQVLAEVVNPNALDVVANIQESKIRKISVGQSVNVTFDAISGTVFKGVVQKIGDATTSVFSLVPNSTAAAGAYTKVVQRIPVTIALSGYTGQPLVVGMNANVSIQISNNS